MAVNKTSKAKPSWMKKGAEAKDALVKEEAQVEQRQSEQNKLFRFWMPNNSQTAITFLDGDLDGDGVLDSLLFNEHNVFMNGNWRNWFVCTKDEEPCPICEGGSNPALVGVFTIIDHTEWTGKGANGKLHKDERKLFVAKRNTLKQLQMIAAKRGGLAGCTFDVMRSGDNSPGCGSVFDFTEKLDMPTVIKQYPDAKDGVADYGHEISYKTADELRALGFGSMPIGTEPPTQDQATNYDGDL
ncbi:MAG: hypothetical protein GQ570_03500 [Helicobacteraceae bacterium]|nr:hypothetical protein [Helicobacteraceae bacterium]